MRMAANTHNVMTMREAAASFAVQRRRERRREEWTEQTRLAALLEEYLDPGFTFWTSLENKPLSLLSGIFQKRRGIRSGLPDVLVIFQQTPGRVLIVFVELKSRAGVATRAQKQLRLELLRAGAAWWMTRSARAALMALHLSGVVFGSQWAPPQLEPWEGPFPDPNERLPQAPEVAAQRRAARQRSRERQRACKAAKLAAERDDAAGADVAA
jgi:hypothetical protein